MHTSNGEAVMSTLSRRTFISAASAIASASFFAHDNVYGANRWKGTLKKSLYYSMIQGNMTIEEKFALAKRAGYDGIEVPTTDDPAVAQEMKGAARKTKLEIHSIMNQLHWRYPLSSDDPQVIEKSLAGMRTSLTNAKDFGAGVVLLVPAVVNESTSYGDAYTRSQKNIRELIPMAEELGIVIAIENVWNKFLLSPLEFSRYIEEIDSPSLKAYFDCGNIALYGYPHDWIRELGDKIVRIHVKGFDVPNKQFMNIGDGTIDWREVRAALSDIGYSGYVNAELRGGDEAYLTDVSKRLGLLFEGEL